MNFQDSNRFYISQRFTALVNRFDLFNDNNELIGFAEQKRFNLREQVSVWRTESRDEVLFSIVAEKIFDVRGKYLVLDGSGQSVGYLRKRFAQSLLRSTWGAYDLSDTLLYEAREKSITIAVIRRLGGFIPVVGEFLEQLPFSFDLEKEGKVVGYHRRQWGIRDKYELAVDDELKATDKRILLALGLLLDILQQR